MKRINKLHSIYNIDVSILLISSIGICLLSIHNRYYQFRVDDLPDEKHMKDINSLLIVMFLVKFLS